MELLLEGAFDRWLVGISAGLFLVSTLLILDDRILFRSASHRRSDLSVIASVALASKDVRRRTSDEVRWLPIRGQEELYANDRLFTGENSQAEVSFLDGTKLGVDAKSLVVIRSQPGSTQLDLERGSVFGNVGAKGKMTLKVGDAISELTAGEGGEPAQLKASLTPAGKTQLTVFSGSVGISVNGRKNVLNKNQSAMLDTQGQVSEIRSFSVELLSPVPDGTIWVKPDEPLPFHWKSAPTSSYVIEVSRTEDFKKSDFRRTTQVPTATAMSLGPGEWYWRVRAGRDGRKESPVSKFRLLADTAVNPTAPAPHALLTRGVRPLLQWVEDGNSPEYVIQVSNESRFQTVLQEISVRTRVAELSALPEGSYYWRVKPKDPRRASPPWSAVSDFRVAGEQPQKATPLPAPEIPEVEKEQVIELGNP